MIHQLVTVLRDDYKTEAYCSCGEMFWHINSYGRNGVNTATMQFQMHTKDPSVSPPMWPREHRHD